MADSSPSQSSGASSPGAPDMASLGVFPPPKARYRGPRADKDTFETQEEFLDSLETIPIESVEHRRCPHCWKDYGESDPGFDNAEAPVKLRCSHVFGENCLRDLFGLPECVKADLIPLSYKPDSKGADLGRRLSKWVSHCGVDKGALLIGGNREKDFTKLVSDCMSTGSRTRNVVANTLGHEWFAVFSSILQKSRKIDKIHILENAIIMDSGIDSTRATIQTQKEIANWGPHAAMHYYPPAPSSLPQNIPLPDLPGESGPFGELGFSGAEWHVYEQAISDMEYLPQLVQAQAELAAMDSELALLGDGLLKTSASPMAMPTSESEGKTAPTATGSEDGGDNTKEKNPIHSFVQKLKGDKLEKLKAKFEGLQQLMETTHGNISKSNASLFQDLKKVQDAEPAATPYSSMGTGPSPSKPLTQLVEEQQAKLAKKPAATSDSSIGADPSSPKPIQQQVEEQQAKLGKILQLMDDPNLFPYLPSTIKNAMVPSEAMAMSEMPVEPMKPSEGFMKLHGVEGENGSWENSIASILCLNKLAALKKFAKKTLKTAEASKIAAQKKQEEMKKRALMMQAHRDAQLKSLTVTLVDTLKTVYQNYEQFMYEQALAAGQPPPVKKLRLASSNADPVASPVPTPSPPEPQFSIHPFTFVRIPVTVHEADLDAKSYRVRPPVSDGGDPSDSEDADTEAVPVKERKIYFMTRMRCTHCASDNSRSDVGELPEYITWGDEKNVPDGCPICRKVLFKKEAKH